MTDVSRERAREKRRARQLRRLAKATCNPRRTMRHRAPCGECYWCWKQANVVRGSEDAA